MTVHFRPKTHKSPRSHTTVLTVLLFQKYTRNAGKHVCGKERLPLERAHGIDL